MDVELQILKHLRRDTHPTVAVIDEYCPEYKELFKEVRNYECFKYLLLGIILLINVNRLEILTNVATCFSQGETLREQAGEPVQRSGSPMTKEKAQSRASRVGGFPDLNELALSGGNLRSELCKNDSKSQLSLISPTYLSALHVSARQDISK